MFWKIAYSTISALSAGKLGIEFFSTSLVNRRFKICKEEKFVFVWGMIYGDVQFSYTVDDQYDSKLMS